MGLKVLFAGTPLNAARTLSSLHENGVEIVGVLTRVDAPVGRKKVLTPSPVAQTAESLGLPIIKANRVDPSILEEIKSLGADLGVVVAFGAIFRTETLMALPKGWINLHYSLLPRWRGAAPVQHAILNGDATTGVSIFQLDEGMDTGPIHSIIPTEITPGETAGELLNRLTNLGISGLLEVIPRVAAGLAVTTPQDEMAVATLASKLNRELAHINWNESAHQIEHLVCAMNPEPMAWTTLDGESFRVITARALGAVDWAALEGTDFEAGSLVHSGNRVLVSCGHGSLLELKDVQPAGKQIMRASDWMRGIKSDQKVLFN